MRLLPADEVRVLGDAHACERACDQGRGSRGAGFDARGLARARVQALVLAWARAETELGRSFGFVQPPADAARANALLARGEIAFGAELRDAANHLPQKTAAIGPYLQRTLGHARGAGIVDRALAKLKAAGYSQPG